MSSGARCCRSTTPLGRVPSILVPDDRPFALTVCFNAPHADDDNPAQYLWPEDLDQLAGQRRRLQELSRLAVQRRRPATIDARFVRIA